MKIIVGLLIFSVSCNCAFSQGDYNNMKKYWFYKTRLNNNFVKVGTGRGESMPFNERGYTSRKNSDGSFSFSTDMLLGDGTATLGYYLGVLATEYYLLKQNGQKTDSVRHELFCALTAFNRCDALAENTTAGTVNNYSTLNGFFIRDDIKEDFVRSNYDHFNYYNNWDGTYSSTQWDPYAHVPLSNATDIGFASLIHTGQIKTYSTFQSWEQDLNNPDPNWFPIENNIQTTDHWGATFESQDQVYDLLLGLALISKFVDDTARDYNSSGNPVVFPLEYLGSVTSILEESRHISDRIIRKMQNDSWRIKYPGTNKVPQGGDALTYAYPIAEAGCFISGNGELGPNASSGSVFTPPHGCGGAISNPNVSYHTLYSGSQVAYELWQGEAAASATKQDVAVFKANLSAISNSLYGVTGGQWVDHWVSQMQHVPVLNWLGIIIKYIWKLVTFIDGVIFSDYLFGNSTPLGMTNNAYDWNLDHTTVLREILHPNVGGYYPNASHSMDYLLDVAPCQGTFNFGSAYWGHIEWSSDNRCDRPDRIGSSGNDIFRGEYNGLDYLLYHNLWAIHKMKNNGNYFYQDLSDAYVNRNGGLINQPIDNVFKVEGYETITVENTTIPDNKKGVFRAGKTIHFGPGTMIGAAADVHAYIDPWGCATDYTPIENLRTTNSNIDSTDKQVHWHNLGVSTVANLSKEPNNVNEEHIDNTAVFINPLDKEKERQDSIAKSIINYVGGNEIKVVNSLESNDVKVYFILEENGFANLELVDVKGGVVFEALNLAQKDNGITINMGDLARGVYILKFIRSNGKQETKKLYKL